MNIRLSKIASSHAIAGCVLFVLLHSFVNGAYANMTNDDEKLVKKFAPILVLTENPTKDYIVLNPEPVEIVGANHITNLWFAAYRLDGNLVDTAPFGDVNWRPEVDDSVYFIGNSDFPEFNVNFVKNKFAFLTYLQTSTYWRGTTPNGSSGTLSSGAPTAENIVVNAESPVIRVAKKLGAGVLGGSLGVLVVFIIGENSDPDPIATVAAGPHMALLGYTFGSPVGVSWVDSRDKGILTWAGSLAGWFVGRMALELDTSWPFAPLIGATMASELWRKPLSTKLHLKPEARRVSVGLVPNPNGGLSAVATLRF